MDFRSRKYWVFDLDGTLTEAVHDFDAIRRMLGIDSGAGILEALEAMEGAQRAAMIEKLDRFEYQLARKAVVAPGAHQAIAALLDRGADLGLVTRNNRLNVTTTLNAIGLNGIFCEETIITREDDLRPKPAADGILALFGRWGANPGHGVMVGNHEVDLLAGRAAGTATVLVDPSGHFRWPEHADLLVQTLDELP